MENKLNRLFVGILISSLVLISYYFDLDFLFFSFISLLILFECFNLKIFNKNFYFFLSIFIFSLINTSLYFIEFIPIYAVIINFMLIITIFFKKKIKILFFFSLLIFLTIFHFILIENRNLFFLIFLFSFVNDTCAYIFGNLIGGRKIIPSISPNKTWSGTLISFFISSIILYLYFNNIIISFVLSSLFFFGDIYFSIIKRELKIKDFSNILSSHGGILDRIDSIYLFTIFLIPFLAV